MYIQKSTGNKHIFSLEQVYSEITCKKHKRWLKFDNYFAKLLLTLYAEIYLFMLKDNKNCVVLISSKIAFCF